MLKQYIISTAFWGIFVIFLYALGNACSKKERSQPYKFMAGYLLYSFFVAIGGIIIQILNLSWNTFAIYMGIVLGGLLIYILIKRRKNGYFMSISIREYIQEHWFLIMIALFLFFMLFVYYRAYWYGNHLDDGYYVTKVATLPYEKMPFRTNYSVGVEKPGIDSYAFNTWELEASFYVKVLGVKATLFLRLFQAGFHYFLALNCILAFGVELVHLVNKTRSQKYLQYALAVTLLFGVYYVYLEETNFFFIRDLFHCNTAMYYGGSLIKVIGILMMLLFLSKAKFDKKSIVTAVMLGVVLISKTAVALPVIFVTYFCLLLIYLLKHEKKYAKYIGIVVGVLYTLAGVILPGSEEMEEVLYKYVLLSLKSPIVPICLVIFGFSFFLKSKAVNRLNAGICLIGFCILAPQVNDVLESISFYKFVVARTYSTFVYTIVCVSGFYLYLLFEKFDIKEKIRDGVFWVIAAIFGMMVIHSFRVDGGELFSEGQLPARTTLIDSGKVILNNPYFTSNYVIQLGDILETLSDETEEQLIVASPESVGIDSGSFTLACQLRTFAPSVISVSASSRYPVSKDNFLYGYDQRVFEWFAYHPSEFAVKRLKQEVDVYGINCIVMPNGDGDTYLEKIGFNLRTATDSDVFRVYTRNN